MNLYIAEIRESEDVSQEFKDRLEDLNLLDEDIRRVQSLLSEDTLFEAGLIILAPENQLLPPLPGKTSELSV